MTNTAIHSDIDNTVYSKLQIEYMVVMIISFICILAIYQAAIIAFRQQSNNSHSSNKSNADISDKIQGTIHILRNQIFRLFGPLLTPPPPHTHCFHMQVKVAVLNAISQNYKFFEV